MKKLFKQGLYDPAFEHDACGIGMVASIKGEKSNKLLRQSLTILKNLAHRGGIGSEPNSGDGAGVMMQLPHAFFKKCCSSFTLPDAGDYGVGMIFLPQDNELQKDIVSKFEKAAASIGVKPLGWRDVPVDPSSLGKTSSQSMPCVKQFFVAREDIAAGMPFERALYILRRSVEKEVQAAHSDCGFYVVSFSASTIIYKGMLTPEQVELFYTDLSDSSLETAIALVHSRFSTNTFPSWERAHPNRHLIHNGEINTLCGNVNFMKSRESMLQSAVFGDDLQKVLPVINPDGSDSAMFDNVVEFLYLSGMPIERVMMMMIPEPWEHHEGMSPEKQAFYEFQSCMMEPWDGPVAMCFTDGKRVGAVLDRNGLRPARYLETTDGFVVLASETGALDIPQEKILRKERLHPGRMLLIDTAAGRIIPDEEIKNSAIHEKPFQKYLEENLVRQADLPKAQSSSRKSKLPLQQQQKAFGYSYEDLRTILTPLARDGADPIGAMGNDIPLAVLSERPQLLYEYFKQLFAQVTNPPIDALREAIVTSSKILLGSEGNLLEPSPASAKRVQLETPIISNATLTSLRELADKGLKAVTLPIVFEAEKGAAGLKEALDDLFTISKTAIESRGVNLLILSDRGVDQKYAAIPALLAVSGLHHFLVREKLRCNTSIILESAEPREVHHFATLLGFGVSAINPYLALDSVAELAESGFIKNKTPEEAKTTYLKGVTKGVIKVLSKMGISTIASYQGAQIFEALGLEKNFIDEYFTGTVSRIGGIGLEGVAREAIARHETAFPAHGAPNSGLDTDGKYQYRREGEYHLFNPLTIHTLQEACRSGSFEKFKEYTALINGKSEKLCTLRGLLEFTPGTPVPIEKVESVESICKRFQTGAMSFGSISQEAHETMAIAMNRLGGKSNTGEGGEDPTRFIPDDNGDSRCSAIKQVASGRFGVTSNYLTHAKEIQIKIAQGAKPGEGGQLPGRKVYPWVAKVRYSTPGVGLISPPPHHDIYSIEDLKELIHDLKCANPEARVTVKLVSETGVGTVAAGVTKGLADNIMISGYDGGTGASPRTSTRHAGLPWELGLSETHQTLVLNNLRDRIILGADGKLMTGRDVAIAALLGAEEFGFATAPLVTLGCVMMRVCNLDTCPVGIATQNPRLRAKFVGDPQDVINFMHFLAEDLREIMASLGFRTIDEMIGHTDRLTVDQTRGHWKTQNLDYRAILNRPNVGKNIGTHHTMEQNHGLDDHIDYRLLPICEPAIKEKKKVEADVQIHNIDRAACTILGNAVTKIYGGDGLPDNTITLHLHGSAGMSFGAFVPRGITLDLEGDSNDYIGKGLSGGRIIVRKPKEASFAPDKNIIVGNVSFYGATSGEAYIGGVAGERFCVRNSGINAVVEAVGDHGCEYMTGGHVVVLGATGRNFAAGMSGGIAYVYDEDGDFNTRCNTEMVDLGPVENKDADYLHTVLQKHVTYTGSQRAEAILNDWNTQLKKFVRVMPRDYARALEAMQQVQAKGLSGEEATLAAFEACIHPANAGTK